MVAARPESASADTSSWLTRQQAADLLDVSITTIKNWDNSGLLHPRKVMRGVPNNGQREICVYDPHELASIPAARRRRAGAISGDAGEVAARAFELFDDGASLRRVVTALRAEPQKVDDLHDQWERMGGREMVISRAAQAEITQIVGVSFDGVATLVGILRRLIRPPLVGDAAANVTGPDEPT